MTQTEHIVLIGPWGWVGWLLFSLVGMLYTLLWRSSRAGELRQMKQELEKARKAINELREMEFDLKNRNDKLRTDYNTMHGEYVELRGKFSQLQIAFDKVAAQMAEQRLDLNKERELRDSQYMELIRERAKNGDL